MPNYEVFVKFDDRIASQSEQRSYFDTLEKYGALGIGHDKEGNSSLFIKSRRPLNRQVLERELGDNKILNIKKLRRSRGRSRS